MEPDTNIPECECCVCYDNFEKEEIITLLCCNRPESKKYMCGNCIAFIYAENMKNISYSTRFQHKCPYCNVPLSPEAILVWKYTYETVFSDEERRQIESFWYKPQGIIRNANTDRLHPEFVAIMQQMLDQQQHQHQPIPKKKFLRAKKPFYDDFEETEKHKKKWELKNPLVSQLECMIDTEYYKSNEVSKFLKRYTGYKFLKRYPGYFE